MERVKSRKGQTVGALIAVVAAAIAMIPITKWYLSLNSGLADVETRFEMQAIVQDAWNRILAEDYDETNERIKEKGSTFTEDVGGKYTLTYTYGNEGKYASAQCNTSATPGDDDQKCRKVAISLAAKDGSVKPYAINTTRVSSASGGGGKMDAAGYQVLFSSTSSPWTWTAPSNGFLILLGGANHGNNIGIVIDGQSYVYPDITWTSSAASGCGSQSDSVTLPVYKGANVSVFGELRYGLFLAMK